MDNKLLPFHLHTTTLSMLVVAFQFLKIYPTNKQFRVLCRFLSFICSYCILLNFTVSLSAPHVTPISQCPQQRLIGFHDGY